MFAEGKLPLFVNAEGFDFHFKKLSMVKKIKFVPFDYLRAGVYGEDEWKSLALFDQEMADEFDQSVRQMESMNKK